VCASDAHVPASRQRTSRDTGCKSSDSERSVTPRRPPQRRSARSHEPRACPLRQQVVSVARPHRRKCPKTRWTRPRLALVAGFALLVAVVVPTSSASAQRGGSAAIIDAYESARTRGDMDTVVGLFADDAVVVDSAGSARRGRQQIRLLLQPGKNRDWAADVTDGTVSGDYIFWIERVGVHGTARSLSVAAIVRGGSIEALAYGSRELLTTYTPSAVAPPSFRRHTVWSGSSSQSWAVLESSRSPHLAPVKGPPRVHARPPPSVERRSLATATGARTCPMIRARVHSPPDLSPGGSQEVRDRPA